MGEEAGDAAPTATPARRSFWGWARLALGVAVLVGLLCWLGTGPFLAGLRLIDAPALAAALAIGVLTTVCAAWRWSLVAGGLGVRLPLREAVAHCYRAIFLNATLPGGILGDVHRAVRHGRDVGDVGRGIRAVVWERMAGQVVLVAVAAVLLFAFPSPVRPFLPLRRLPVGPSTGHRRVGRTPRAARPAYLGRGPARLRAGGGRAPRDLPGGRTHGGFDRPADPAVAADPAGPARDGGAGERRRVRPREGVAAWAFAAAGLTAAEGVATATVYGALVLVASLPGAAVLLARRVRVPATV